MQEEVEEGASKEDGKEEEQEEENLPKEGVKEEEGKTSIIQEGENSRTRPREVMQTRGRRKEEREDEETARMKEWSTTLRDHAFAAVVGSWLVGLVMGLAVGMGSCEVADSQWWNPAAAFVSFIAIGR